MKTKNTKTSTPKATAPTQPQPARELKNIPLSDIDPAVNYRKSFNPQTLQELAEDIRKHDMLSPVTVRPAANGRYQLVIGDRRYRAAHLIGMAVLPALIRELTDEEMLELQLAENLQREDPHPLHEAQAVSLLQASGKSIEDISLRMGKSKAWVYNRIKIAQLIDPVQEVFLADKISFTEALEIAAIAADSQQRFFERNLKHWQDENFALYNIRSMLSQYHCNLSKAPFDTKNKKLVADAGACTRCPFNSATLKSLFPELAQQATCSKKTCYESKCLAQLTLTLQKEISNQQPAALILPAYVSDSLRTVIDSLPEASSLPQYEYSAAAVCRAPEAPDRQDYEGYDEEDEFDEQGYQDALSEYNAELEAHQQLIADPATLKCLHLVDPVKGVFTLLYFNPERKAPGSKSMPVVTAKEVQEAIKAKTETPELLQAEIDRIEAREVRQQELDAEKIQQEIHRQFLATLFDPQASCTLTQADAIAARLIIYQSLDYSVRYKVDEVLFGEKDHYHPGNSSEKNQQRYEQLAALTNEQLSFLIRCAVAGKSESKLPGNINAHCLYAVAAEAGTDLVSIEAAQQTIAAKRGETAHARIADMQERIAKLQVPAEAA